MITRFAELALFMALISVCCGAAGEESEKTGALPPLAGPAEGARWSGYFPSGEYGVYVVSPLVKLRPDQLPCAAPANEGRMDAAKGEGESIQLMVAAREPLKNVAVTVTDMQGPNGYRFPLEMHQVRYVSVTTPTAYGYGVPGFYPDPLWPLEPLEIRPGELQPLWVTAWVPRDAPAGNYTATVEIAPANAPPTAVKLHLRVYNVTLPVQSYLKTAMLIQGPRQQLFAELALRYRCSAMTQEVLPWNQVFAPNPADGSWTAHWEEFDREVESWLAQGATVFLMNNAFADLNHDHGPSSSEKLRLLDQHLTERGWSERFIFFIVAFDEPKDTPEMRAKIQKTYAFIHEHGPHLKILSTSWPRPFNEAMIGYVDVWVPPLTCWYTDPDFWRARKAAGDQTWMYTCITGARGRFPDLWKIDWTGCAHRAVGWWLWWAEDCEGYLYWAMNAWFSADMLNPDPYPYVDDMYGNGDGYLFYYRDREDQHSKTEAPYPSVRIELVRDGFEDYDLLSLLGEAVGRAHNQPALRDQAVQAEKLLSVNDVIFGTMDSAGLSVKGAMFADQPSVYERRHREILEVLEAMNRDE